MLRVPYFMPITDLKAIQQALASVRLEGLEPSEDTANMLKLALFEGNLTTTDIIEAVKNK